MAYIEDRIPTASSRYKRAARMRAAQERRARAEQERIAQEAFSTYRPQTPSAPSRRAVVRAFSDPAPLTRPYGPFADSTILEDRVSEAESAAQLGLRDPGGPNPPSTLEALLTAASIGLPGPGLAVKGGLGAAKLLAGQAARQSVKQTVLRPNTRPTTRPTTQPRTGQPPSNRELAKRAAKFTWRVYRGNPLTRRFVDNYLAGGGPFFLPDTYMDATGDRELVGRYLIGGP